MESDDIIVALRGHASTEIEIKKNANPPK